MSYFSHRANFANKICLNKKKKRLIRIGKFSVTASEGNIGIKPFPPSLAKIRERNSETPKKFIYGIGPWRNEEQKVDKEKKRYSARMTVLQALI